MSLHLPHVHLVPRVPSLAAVERALFLLVVLSVVVAVVVVVWTGQPAHLGPHPVPSPVPAGY